VAGIALAIRSPIWVQ